jgi:hypothetical protein
LHDEFLEFAASRARPNSVRAYTHDLKTFFTVVEKDPLEVRAADVMGLCEQPGRPRGSPIPSTVNEVIESIDG